MRDAATLELVRLLLSVEGSSREKMAELIMSLSPETAKTLSTLLEQSQGNVLTLNELVRLRSNVSNSQCIQAVGIVCPEVIETTVLSEKSPVAVFEPIPVSNPSNGYVQNWAQSTYRMPASASLESYTAELQIDNLRAELQKEVESPSDLRKEYYYLRDGKKRSFVMGSKLFDHLSRVCNVGGQSKRGFLDALGQKVERSEFSPSSKLKSKTMRKEVLQFILTVEGSSALRREENRGAFQKAQAHPLRN